jgi:hypothetical protein
VLLADIAPLLILLLLFAGPVAQVVADAALGCLVIGGRALCSRKSEYTKQPSTDQKAD